MVLSKTAKPRKIKTRHGYTLSAIGIERDAPAVLPEPAKQRKTLKGHRSFGWHYNRKWAPMSILNNHPPVPREDSASPPSSEDGKVVSLPEVKVQRENHIDCSDRETSRPLFVRCIKFCPQS